MCCTAGSYQPIVYGLISFRVPAFDAVPTDDQVRTPGPLLGAIGPRPLFSDPLKLAPDPGGIAQQLLQIVPIHLAVGGVDGLPVETVPGIDDAIGTRLSKPQGLKSSVKFERELPFRGV